MKIGRKETKESDATKEEGDATGPARDRRHRHRTKRKTESANQESERAGDVCARKVLKDDKGDGLHPSRMETKRRSKLR